MCCIRGWHLYPPPPLVIFPLSWQFVLPARSSRWKSGWSTRFLYWPSFQSHLKLAELWTSQGRENSLFSLERFYVKEKFSLYLPWRLKLLRNMNLFLLFNNATGTGRDKKSFSLSGRGECSIIFYVSLSRIKMFCGGFSCGWPLLSSKDFWKLESVNHCPVFESAETISVSCDQSQECRSEPWPGYVVFPGHGLFEWVRVAQHTHSPTAGVDDHMGPAAKEESALSQQSKKRKKCSARW